MADKRNPTSAPGHGDDQRTLRLLEELLEQSREQTRLLTDLRGATGLDACLLDKIAAFCA